MNHKTVAENLNTLLSMPPSSVVFTMTFWNEKGDREPLDGEVCWVRCRDGSQTTAKYDFTSASWSKAPNTQVDNLDVVSYATEKSFENVLYLALGDETKMSWWWSNWWFLTEALLDAYYECHPEKLKCSCWNVEQCKYHPELPLYYNELTCASCGEKFGRGMGWRGEMAKYCPSCYALMEAR